MVGAPPHDGCPGRTRLSSRTAPHSRRNAIMTRPFQDWEVLPHGKLSQIDDNILTVVGEIEMPLTTLLRRMTVVRLNDSRLVRFSPVALADNALAALEAFGRPAYLIVPSDKHRLAPK